MSHQIKSVEISSRLKTEDLTKRVWSFTGCSFPLYSYTRISFFLGVLSSLLAASVHWHISLYVKYPEMKLHRCCPFQHWTHVIFDSPQASSGRLIQPIFNSKSAVRGSVYLLLWKTIPKTSHRHKGRKEKGRKERKERKLLKKEKKTCKNQADGSDRFCCQLRSKPDPRIWWGEMKLAWSCLLPVWNFNCSAACHHQRLACCWSCLQLLGDEIS